METSSNFFENNAFINPAIENNKDVNIIVLTIIHPLYILSVVKSKIESLQQTVGNTDVKDNDIGTDDRGEQKVTLSNRYRR